MALLQFSDEANMPLDAYNVHIEANKFDNELWSAYCKNKSTPKNWGSYLKYSNVLADKNPARHPILKGLNWNNLLVAGGYFTATKKTDVDLDLFIYGLDHNDALKKVAEITDHILKSEYTKTNKVNVIRTAKTLSFIFNKPELNTIQIILAYARDPLEVLLSFDFTICKIGFNGMNLLKTTSFELAYEHKMFIVSAADLMKSSAHSIGYRMKKYRDRGYEIVSQVGEYEVVNNATRSGYDSFDLETKYGISDYRFFENVVVVSYKKQPDFIALRYLNQNEMLSPQVGLVFYCKSSIWHYMNYPVKYIEFLKTQRYLPDLPNTTLNGPITMIPIVDFIKKIHNP